jgi:hypothetical protein
VIGPLGENLIFAIGTPRSGTTLVQRVLAGHSKIFATAEPWIMLHPLYALRDAGHTADYDANLAREGLKDFCQVLPGGEQAYVEGLRHLFCGLYNGVTPADKQCFLDKTPRYFYIAPELKRVFPAAKFVFILRNPLAILASTLDSWLKGEWHAFHGHLPDLKNGPRHMAAALDFFKGDSIQFRYENFAQHPEPEFSLLCDRLELPFEPDMLNYGTKPKPFGRMGDAVGIPKHTHPVNESVQKWMETLSDPKHRFLAERYLEWLPEDTCTRLGYPKSEMIRALNSLPAPPSECPMSGLEDIFK